MFQNIWVCIAHGQSPNFKSDDFDIPLLPYNRHPASLGNSPTSMNDSTEGKMETSVLFSHLLELTQVLHDTQQSLL